MKRRRAQYRKNWAAANRALRRSGAALPDNNDDSDFDELNFNPSQRSTNFDTDSEHDEPTQKSTCTSPVLLCTIMLILLVFGEISLLVARIALQVAIKTAACDIAFRLGSIKELIF